MTDPVTIVLEGDPVPISRVRFSRVGTTYTPTRTRNYLGALSAAAKAAMGERAPLDGPIEVTVLFEMRIPKVSSRTKRNAMILGLIRHTHRPDLDNLIKALDALNGIVWHDDSQVVSVSAQKRYGVQPKVVITVERSGSFADKQPA